MRLLSTIRLTDSQKRVIAKISAAATPTVAGEEISKDANLVAARNMLMKLGVITFVDNRAEITDKGNQLAVEENIVDEQGELTELGNKLAFTASNGQPTGDAAQGGDTMAGGMEEPPMDPSIDPAAQAPGEVPPPGDELSLESFALLKQVLS